MKKIEEKYSKELIDSVLANRKERAKKQALYLRELLQNERMSQKELADSIGVSVVTVSRWTNGKTNISIENAFKISELFSCQFESLMGY